MPSAPHSHFWPDGGVGGAVQRAARRRGTAPAPCAPSSTTGTSTSASSAGATSPETQPTCEHATSVVVARTAFAELAERHEPDLDAAVARGLQRPDQPGVLAVGGHDLVAGPEVQPGQHRPDPLARRGVQRDVGDASEQHARVQRPQLGQRRARLQCAPNLPSRPPPRASRAARTAAAAAARPSRRSDTRRARGRGTRRAGRRDPCGAGA